MGSSYGNIGGFFGLGSQPDAPGNNSLTNYAGNPNSSALRQMLGNMQGPTAVNAGSVDPSNLSVDGSSYQAKDMSNAALPQYDAMRQRLQSQYSQNQGQAQDALDRQFAASGGGPGNGAQAKQTENLAASTEAAKSNDLQGINAQEAQTRQQLQQQENQNAFQSQEATKGRVLQGQEFNLGQQNQAAQFNTQEGLQAGEFNTGQQQAFNQFQFGAGSSLAQLDQGYQEANEQAANDAFNQSTANFTSKHSGGVLGGGGFLGTGLGA